MKRLNSGRLVVTMDIPVAKAMAFSSIDDLTPFSLISGVDMLRRRWIGVFLVAMALCVANCCSSVFAAEYVLTYVTPRGVSLTVNENGLTTIRKGFGAVIDGEWIAFNGESWFKDGGTNEVQIPPPEKRTIQVLSPKHAQVRHEGGDVVCVYDYTFEEEDVLITCRFENHSESATVNVVGFKGLNVHFARAPTGVMPVETQAYFQEHGLGACHPSRFSPIGGGYAADKDVGIGIAPWNRSLFRTLLHWDYADWDDSERVRVLERKLSYFANLPVLPGGAATFGLKIRVSPDMDWKHLLEPYKGALEKLHGTVRYKSDARWIAAENLSKAETESVPLRRLSPNNVPPGQSRSRNIETASGAQALCDAVIPRLIESNGQGVILWGYGTVDGVEQTGIAEFDVLPPDVADQWDRITEQFLGARLKFGVATSPRLVSVRKTWTENETIKMNPGDPGHREMLWHRYEEMMNRNCSLFYLDNFGSSLEDVMLMRWLREKMGPEVQTFADQPCDLILFYSGAYTGATLKTGSSAGLERGYQLQVGDKNWEILQWLVPNSQLIGQLTEIKGVLTDALESPERYCYSRRITPMLSVSDFKRAPAIKKLQPLYMEENGTWLPPRK